MVKDYSSIGNIIDNLVKQICAFKVRLRGVKVRLRGVQYVHWVMHKCIMVKVGGKRNTHKVCKKQVNFYKTDWKFFKVGGNNNFRETVGKCTESGKLGGNSKFVVDD